MLEIEGEHPDKLLLRNVTEKNIGSAFEGDFLATD